MWKFPFANCKLPWKKWISMLLKMCKFSNTSFNQTYKHTYVFTHTHKNTFVVLPYLFLPFIKVYSRHVAKRLRSRNQKTHWGYSELLKYYIVFVGSIFLQVEWPWGLWYYNLDSKARELEILTSCSLSCVHGYFKAIDWHQWITIHFGLGD